MNAQEVFDKIVNHLRQQGCQSKSKFALEQTASPCAYRGDGGTKCAAGCLIPDEEYTSSMEGMYWPTLCKNKLPGQLADELMPHQYLILDLQRVHDLNVRDVKSVKDWEKGFKRIAQEYLLVYTPPN